MFDRLWAWIMGIITYLASLFGLNRANTEGAKEEVVEAAPEPADPAPSE